MASTTKAVAAQYESTLALDVMRSCSIKHGMASVIFSLEMSKSEIVMRLLSAEARIKLAQMRAGRMSDDDWTRMAAVTQGHTPHGLEGLLENMPRVVLLPLGDVGVHRPRRPARGHRCDHMRQCHWRTTHHRFLSCPTDRGVRLR